MKHRGLPGMLRLVAITVAMGLSATHDVYSYQSNQNYSRAYNQQYVKYLDYQYSVRYDYGRYAQYGYKTKYADYANIAYSNRWEHGKTYEFTYPSYNLSKASGWRSYSSRMFQPDAYRAGGTYYGYSLI